jgi:hypothetical protein
VKNVLDIYERGMDQLINPAKCSALFSVICSQEAQEYIMGVFKLPASVCDDLNRIIHNYWWGSANSKRKTHWVGWPKLLRSKMQGGMGFTDMRFFYKALLARQAWRLLVFPDSLCAQVLRARYNPNGELMDTVFMGNPSSTWTTIGHGVELLKKGLIWRVGNGQEHSDLA